MIHTLIIGIFTVFNCVCGFYWIRRLKIDYKNDKRKRHIELCSICIEVGSCPHNCKVCAWGDFMTNKQINHENRTKKFYKEIMKYHRRHKNER